MRYSIPEENIETLEKKLTRIKNKCAKYGNVFKYERIGEHFGEIKHVERDSDGCVVSGWTETIRYIDVEVEGTAVINGWRFVASLDYTEKGNVISGVSNVEVPERYYSCAPWCEHCKTARDRKHSYIVFNGEEFKQVGRSCLRDFTGGYSAELAASIESCLKECEEASEINSGSWSGAASWFPVEEFMSYLAETIRLYGYVRREFGVTGTAERAEELFRADTGMRFFGGDAARARVADAKAKGFDAKNGVELAGKVREWVLGNERDDNYFHNLKVACALEFGGRKVLGLLASAFPVYDRNLEVQAEKLRRAEAEAEAREASAWMGKVGEKVTFKIADFRVIASWDGRFGQTTVYKFVDENGHEATWKTGNYVGERCIGGTVTGFIKELKEWRGIRQTELTRCRVAEVPRTPEWVDTPNVMFEALDLLEQWA